MPKTYPPNEVGFHPFAFFKDDGTLNLPVEGQTDFDNYLASITQLLIESADEWERENKEDISKITRGFVAIFESHARIKKELQRLVEEGMHVLGVSAKAQKQTREMLESANCTVTAEAPELIDLLKLNESTSDLLAKWLHQVGTVAEFARSHAWDTALLFQQTLMAHHQDNVRLGHKISASLASARACRRGPSLDDVERVLERLGEDRPDLQGQTARCRVAAKELGCHVRTVFRRLSERSDDNN